MSDVKIDLHFASDDVEKMMNSLNDMADMCKNVVKYLQDSAGKPEPDARNGDAPEGYRWKHDDEQLPMSSDDVLSVFGNGNIINGVVVDYLDTKTNKYRVPRFAVRTDKRFGPAPDGFRWATEEDNVNSYTNVNKNGTICVMHCDLLPHGYFHGFKSYYPRPAIKLDPPKPPVVQCELDAILLSLGKACYEDALINMALLKNRITAYYKEHQ